MPRIPFRFTGWALSKQNPINCDPEPLLCSFRSLENFVLFSLLVGRVVVRAVTTVFGSYKATRWVTKLWDVSSASPSAPSFPMYYVFEGDIKPLIHLLYTWLFVYMTFGWLACFKKRYRSFSTISLFQFLLSRFRLCPYFSLQLSPLISVSLCHLLSFSARGARAHTPGDSREFVTRTKVSSTTSRCWYCFLLRYSFPYVAKVRHAVCVSGCYRAQKYTRKNIEKRKSTKGPLQ